MVFILYQGLIPYATKKWQDLSCHSILFLVYFVAIAIKWEENARKNNANKP